MKRFSFLRTGAMALAATIFLGLDFAGSADAAERKSFKLVWGHYTGYAPWAWAEKAGYMDKWAEKYGIDVEIVALNDYIETLNQFTAGQYDAVATTVMDTLTIPAAGGVDTTAIILGDYTNGNDAIFVKGEGKTMADLKGKKVYLVQYSVSHYMLALALEKAGMSEDDIETANIADADFVAAFSTPAVEAVVTWNPATTQLNAMEGITSVFDSSEVPGEVQDILVVNTAVLEANPEFGKALAGAWYETLAVMKKDDAEGIAAREYMAGVLGTDWHDASALVPVMASEDFSYYLDEVPGAFALIGADDGDGHDVPCHSPRYDFNDRLIDPVAGVLARLAGAPENPEHENPAPNHRAPNH